MSDDAPRGEQRARDVAAALLAGGMSSYCASLLSEELRDALTPISASVHHMDAESASYVRVSVRRICALLDVLTGRSDVDPPVA